MDNELKNEHQKTLFELIKKELSESQVLVDVIAELLEISSHSAYRRIRGEKLLDFEEFVFLCNHFKIPLESIVAITTYKCIQCRYSPMDLRNEENYRVYLRGLLNHLEEVRSNPDGEVILSAVDIPMFQYGSYKELVQFIIFSWNSSVYGYTGKYEEFIKEHDLSEILRYYEKIADSYLQLPSTEIWTINTIDRLVKLVDYHAEMGHFENKNFPFTLCEHLLDLINTLEQWTEKETKGSEGQSFKLYVSEIHLSNTFILFKKCGSTNCALKLFTVNHLNINNDKFCQEAEQWLTNTVRRSTMISGASQRERHKFFAGKRKKVDSLVEMLQQNKHHSIKKDFLANFWNSFP